MASTENAVDFRIKKSTNLRNHRSLAALDTSNPNYKKMSPTRCKSPIKLSVKSPAKSSVKSSFKSNVKITPKTPVKARTQSFNSKSLNYSSGKDKAEIFTNTCRIPNRIHHFDYFVSEIPKEFYF